MKNKKEITYKDKCSLEECHCDASEASFCKNRFPKYPLDMLNKQVKHETKKILNGLSSAEYKKKWMDDNCGISQVVSNDILPFVPPIGMIVNINRVDIPEKIFPKEFAAITKAYFSVLKKMNEHYKKLKK